MSHDRKNFIPRNEGFSCESCGFSTPPARGTFRNHCPNCLTSKHVDGDIPGDRSAECGGLMPAIAIEGTIDNLDLLHRCVLCGHEKRNKLASDDNQEAIFALLESPKNGH